MKYSIARRWLSKVRRNWVPCREVPIERIMSAEWHSWSIVSRSNCWARTTWKGRSFRFNAATRWAVSLCSVSRSVPAFIVVMGICLEGPDPETRPWRLDPAFEPIPLSFVAPVFNRAPHGVGTGL